MLKIKRVISLFLILAVIATFFIAGSAVCSAAGTGIGLAEHALNAYNSGWAYVYGGASAGAVDCSGLIYMYAGGARTATAQVYAASDYGYTSNGVPNIHGLGVWQDGHVGVYVGGGMAVDARGDEYGVCYQSVYTKSWVKWFKVSGVSYPTDGWESFCGDYYYYQGGEYLASTSITIDGVSYSFDSTGACTSTPGDTSAVAGSSGSTGTSSSSGSGSSSVIKLGSSGDGVIRLQNRLKELGFFNDDVTGYFGSVTEAAYIRFQTAAGVAVDGIAGASDLEILYSDYAPTGSAANSSDNTTTTTPENTEPTQTEEEPEPETPTSFSFGDYHDGVYDIQSELATLGYFDDDATGYYGDMTKAAVVKFQCENGLDTTGDVDELTLEAIFSSTALVNPYIEDSSERIETLKAPANTAPTAQATTASIPATQSDEAALKSAQLAAKALEGVNVDGEPTQQGSSRSGSFVVWLVIMVAFMATAFWLVFANERKKKKARAERIRARANRSW